MIIFQFDQYSENKDKKIIIINWLSECLVGVYCG